jgi:hypothetical protein
VQELVERGHLYRVSGAPEFSHSIYAVYPSCVGNETLDRVRDGLRACLPVREPRA